MSAVTVDDFKIMLGCKKDCELAKKVGLHHSTICAWKRNGFVPRKYVETRSKYMAQL